MKQYHPSELIPSAPLVHFRILFGLMMALSVLRFYYHGWIESLYIEPVYFFSYFDWLVPPGSTGIYLLFGTVFLSALGIMLGLFYRQSACLFFLSFTYIELIDKTNYLNHYYFVSLIGFILIFLPAHRDFSLDAIRLPKIKRLEIPRWTTDLIKFQLALVYVFAGIAKLNPDWLFRAMPLKLWLPAQAHIPIIGPLLSYEITPFLFSWGGALYDLFLVFFLLYRPTRWLAYLAVVVFHILTAMLFPIGIFPYVMIISTLIFFSPEAHENILNKIKNWVGSIKRVFLPPAPIILKDGQRSDTHQETSSKNRVEDKSKNHIYTTMWSWKNLKPFLICFIIIQLVIPFRYLAYPGHLFWTEQGYRFSWRVMLMEKAGYTTFTVADELGKKTEWINNRDYLTAQQEKMMSTQPDMILQFAHHIADVYQEKGYQNPVVHCQSRVTLNGTLSQPLVNPKVNLAEIARDWKHKSWLLPFDPDFGKKHLPKN